MWNTTPKMTFVNAAKGRKQQVFSSQVALQAGQRTGVRSDIAVDKIVLPSGQPDIFLGVSIICQDPSKNTVLDVEGGTNTWTSGIDFDIPVVGTFTAKTTGTYTCVTQLGICDPGSCTSPKGQGSVTLLTESTNPDLYSFLFITGALPSWAMAMQIPKGNDTLLTPGNSLPMTKAFDLTNATGSIGIGSIVSLTNCTVANYPPACNGAKKMAVDGSAKVTVTITATQIAQVAGTKCATMTGPVQKQTVTWREHHAVFDPLIRNFVLSNTPGCGQAVQVTTKVSVAKGGNSIVVEGGSKNVWESATFVIPANLVPPYVGMPV